MDKSGQKTFVAQTKHGRHVTTAYAPTPAIAQFLTDDSIPKLKQEFKIYSPALFQLLDFVDPENRDRIEEVLEDEVGPLASKASNLATARQILEPHISASDWDKFQKALALV